MTSFSSNNPSFIITSETIVNVLPPYTVILSNVLNGVVFLGVNPIGTYEPSFFTILLVNQ